MKNVVRGWCGVAMLAAIGCGASDDKTDDDGMKRAQVSGPNAMAGSTAAGSGGAGSNSMATAGKTGGVAGMTMSNAGGSGGKPATAMGAGGAGGTMMMPDKPAQVLVDPADIAACDPAGAPPSEDEVVEVLDIKTSDAVPGGFTAPGGTYYGCFWAEIDMPEKHHIIGWEGAVGGDRAVHHQQVSLSKRPIYVQQQGQLCGLPTVDYTWTGEKPTEWTPKLAGYPVGGPENGGKAYFLWQTHFESATTYSGGFKVYITKNLRKYDAGNFEQGDVAGIMIPPMSAATHVADCTPEMTTERLTHPIYIFAAMQHAHLTVTHIKSEMLRDGKVEKTFGDQGVMGFAGFFDQQFKPVTPCLEVKGGDQLKTTCEYMNNGPVMITGGEAANQEMCTTFFQYFPRLPNSNQNFCGTIDATGGFTM